MAKLATIYGGSGFLGRRVTQQLAQRGWRIRVAVRRPDEALFTRTYGVVGQIAPVLCNIRDAASVALAMEDADAVINCVNITRREGASTFDNVFHLGAENIARLSAEQGIARIVHVSGIGVDPDSNSRYVREKAEGEAAVLKYRPDAVVLRPSVMFGNGDSLYNRFAALARLSPVLSIAGGNTRMQPVYVEDVAAAAALAAEGDVPAGIYELGGPEVMTVREIVGQTLAATNRRRGVINLPFWLAGIGAGVMDIAQAASGGIIKNNILTRDQLAMLRDDNVVAEDAQGFEALGIAPTAPAAIIDEYLWRFRPSGQYDEIKESAGRLRDI